MAKSSAHALALTIAWDHRSSPGRRNGGHGNNRNDGRRQQAGRIWSVRSGIHQISLIKVPMLNHVILASRRVKPSWLAAVHNLTILPMPCITRHPILASVRSLAAGYRRRITSSTSPIFAADSTLVVQRSKSSSPWSACTGMRPERRQRPGSRRRTCQSRCRWSR